MEPNIHISDISGSVVNVKGTIGRVILQAKDCVALRPDAREHLTSLLEALDHELKKAPQDQLPIVVLIGKRAAELVEQLDHSSPPTKAALEISGKGLIDATHALSQILPEALIIAEKIVKFVTSIV